MVTCQESSWLRMSGPRSTGQQSAGRSVRAGFWRSEGGIFLYPFRHKLWQTFRRRHTNYNWKALQNLKNNNTDAINGADKQLAGPLPIRVVPTQRTDNTPNSRATEVILFFTSRDFSVLVRDKVTGNIVGVKNWGFSWDNHVSEWLNTDTPPVPAR